MINDGLSSNPPPASGTPRAGARSPFMGGRKIKRGNMPSRSVLISVPSFDHKASSWTDLIKIGDHGQEAHLKSSVELYLGGWGKPLAGQPGA